MRVLLGKATRTKILVSTEFLRLTVLLSLIYGILELYYNFFISTEFQYMGFKPDLNLVKYFITKLVFIGIAIASYYMYCRNKFLYSIFLFLIFFFYIPNAIIFSLSNGAIGPFVSNVIFVSIFSFTPYVTLTLPAVELSQRKKDILMILLPIGLLLPIIATYKTEINLSTLLLKDIYETREVFSEKMVGYLSYIYNFEVKTIIPIAFVFFMVRRKMILVGLMALALLYLYVISGNKIVYFTTFIIVFFYYLGANYTSKVSNFFMITLLLLFVAPIIDKFVFQAPILQGTFVNRFLFIPALLTQWYFEFFEGNPFYFAESHFFNQFVESPYEMPVGFLLTKIYWNEPTVYANNGLVSDGFMNLGYVGVLLFSLIFAGLFSLFNSFKLNKGYFGLFFCYLYIILSAPLLTSLITGGIVLFVMIWIFIINNKTTS